MATAPGPVVPDARAACVASAAASSVRYVEAEELPPAGSVAWTIVNVKTTAVPDPTQEGLPLIVPKRSCAVAAIVGRSFAGRLSIDWNVSAVVSEVELYVAEETVSCTVTACPTESEELVRRTMCTVGFPVQSWAPEFERNVEAFVECATSG